MITKHTPENDLHAWLREQTRARHQTLDRSPLLHALLQPVLDPDTYLRCLRHLHAAHASTEAWLTGLAGHAPTALPAYQPRLPALREDIEQLARHVPGAACETAAPAHASDAASQSKSSPCDDTVPPPWHDGVSAYLGIRYVLEGATQGARFITARLQKYCPQVLEKSRSYWDHQARMTEHWHALLEYLRTDQRHIEPGALLQGADATFNHFIQVFSTHAHGTDRSCFH
ncbi:MAG: biliverdin-producing heme oxygenase [Castellaniella sp.]